MDEQITRRRAPQGAGRPAVPPDPASHPPSHPQRPISPRARRFPRNTTSAASWRSAASRCARRCASWSARTCWSRSRAKGTFVSSNPPKRLAPVRYTGFLEELQERVRKLRVTEVEIAQAPATTELKAALAARRGDVRADPDQAPAPHRRRAVLLHAELPADRDRRAHPHQGSVFACRS